MKSRSRCFLTMVLSLAISSLGSTALANPHSSQSKEETPLPRPIIYDTIQNLFQEAITYESGNFYRNRSAEAQAQLIFGLGEGERSVFPENEITRDSNLLHILYEDYIKKQSQGTRVRTRDLESPYSTSLNSPDYPEITY